MWRERLILSLLVLSRSSNAIGIDDGDLLRTISVGSDPSTILNEIDLLDRNDPRLEETLTYGEMRMDDIDNPYHMIPLDEQDSPILDPSTTRKLSATSAKIGTFSPLECNPSTWSTCDAIDASDLPNNGSPFVVPCGECNRFEITGNVTLNGLDIKGKLLFPVNHKVNIFTPFVIVQGELEINVDHSKVSPDNLATRFTLTGTDDVMFTPTNEPNLNACDEFSNGCNIGVKPFLVAGGKVNINSMPDTCTTHTPIKKKIHKDPVYNPVNFTQFVTFPPSCPQSGINFLNYDFDDNTYGNWTGREGGFVVMADGAMKITNRKIQSRGPEIDLTPIRPELCLVPDQDYVFVSRVKLDMANRTMHGEDTTCKKDGKYCPELWYVTHDRSRERSHRFITLAKHIAPKYGEYVDFYGTIKFTEAQLSFNNAYYALLIREPERGIDITVDSFEMFLPTEETYQDPNALCQELVLNGDAEANGFSPYPMVTQRGDERLRIVEENGNKFFQLSNRYNSHSSINYRIDTNCLTKGVTYIISNKMRYSLQDGFVGGSDSYYWYIYFQRKSDGNWISRKIVECDAQSAEDGWVKCSGEFMIDEELAETTSARLYTYINNGRDGGKYNLDYDDISIRYHKGYVNEVVVDKADTSCWGDEADVHVTSSTFYSWSSLKTNGYLSKIENVVDNGDGSANVQMKEASTLPIISQEENPDYAAEIALVTRNVIIEGEEGEDRKGGYMQVLHTPNVAQTVQGVEFRNMGRRGELDRYAFQFLYSGNVEGSQIAGNSFRQSNQRCVSVEGTSNVTISQNIGYQSSGDCIHIGYQSESNLITRNLVSDIRTGGSVSGESDDRPSGFRNRYNPNDYTYNIAVGSARYGFVLSDNYQTRLEDGSWVGTNIRKITMGTFHGNVAKACANEGLYFAYHESDEEIVLSNAKAIKNRYNGLYFYSSRNVTIVDSLFADNTQYGVYLRYMDNIDIQDTVILGVTPETKALVKPPYFNEPCVTSRWYPPIGLNMPTNINWWDYRDNRNGLNLTNVVFSDFDHSDKCTSSVPIGFRTGDQRTNHFDYMTMFKNVTFEGSKKMDALTSAENNVKDIAIHDIDGSSDPLGQASYGMFVSNVNRLKAFSDGECNKYADGVSYCANSCYRTVSFMVEQSSTTDFDLRITRTTDGEAALVPFTYKYDGDEYNDEQKKHYEKNYRFFSASLPEGSYQVEFLKDLQLQWPTFVLPRWGGMPTCEGYVSAENITLLEPEPSCDELIINGDMEQGSYLWQHRDWSIKDDSLEVMNGGGVNNSTALRCNRRSRNYMGIGQNLDTRCMRQTLNEFYEVELYFRLEEGTTPFTCDRYGDSNTRCPYIGLTMHSYIDEKIKESSITPNSKVIYPNDVGDWNYLHGVFKVEEAISSAERVFLYLKGPAVKFSIIMDNVSVNKMPGICGEDLIRNGNFEENDKFWYLLSTAKLGIESFNNKALKVYDKGSGDHGARQYLYIDSSCFSKSQRYMVTGKFKIASPSDGTTYQCDRTTWDGDLECSNIRLDYSSPIGNGYERYTETAATAANLFHGWSLMSGVMTVTEQQAAHTSMYVRLYGTSVNMNVFYDDISIVPIPQFCDNLLLNSDFEIGDSRFWLPSDRRYIDIDISSSGADGSQYSLMVKKYTSNRIRQSLDTRCLVEGQEYLISAKFRYLNETDLTSGVDCYPSILKLSDKKHCPTVKIRGTDCAGDDLEYIFWNDIDQFTWDPNSFNNFEKVFPIGSEIASCETVMLEIGHYVHSGRVLLVDDIEMTQRTTLPPTPFPTFSPTKGKNIGPTIQPSIQTERPTTTNIIPCPLVGDSSVSLDSGSLMLKIATSTLCSLNKAVTSRETGDVTLIPIARSYDGNKWEQAAGDYAFSLFNSNEILCYTEGCQVNLPSLESDSEYLLITSAYSLSEKDEYARFLETATFGITTEELDHFEASSMSVEEKAISWVYNQMNVTNVPMTSHREFWRKGVNNRLPTSYSTGTPDHPCDINSRWRRISFVEIDNTEGMYSLKIIGTGPFRLVFDGSTRTVVDNLTIDQSAYANYTFDPNFDYMLCRTPEQKIGGSLDIILENGVCVTVQNPAANLDGYEHTISSIFNIPDDSLEPIDNWLNGDKINFKLTISMFDDLSFSSLCSSLPALREDGDETIFGKLSDGTWLIFDPRLRLEKNTLDSPIVDGGKEAFLTSGGKTYCSNVPRTFLNENGCVLSSNACKPSSNSQVDILLQNSTISAINILSGRYVYAIKGLLVKYDGISLDHPCTPGLRSRWVPMNLTDCNPTPLYGNTTESLTDLISDSGDRNPYMRDIFFPEQGKECEAGDTDPEIEIEVDGVCWKRVHDEHMSIFDMTYWVGKHPGGAYNIQKWSENNGTILVYPSLLERQPHGMANWNNNWHKFTFVGRFGDTIRLGDLPNSLRSIEVTNYFDNSASGDNSQVLVCGSPGEISNSKNEEYLFEQFIIDRNLPLGRTRNYVWIMIALSATDQLRQRVAWALSQIIVVVKSAIASEYDYAEQSIVYYDIFVRHAFGNYRDILREISYNPLMAENLSFLGSKSSAYMLETYRVTTSADENFAREIMQLFSLGIIKLNMDGSPKLDENGDTTLAYTNDDIMSFSRAWTGFDLQPQRGNVESRGNRVDPMRIIPEWRDRFPKSDTTSSYIGDGYPLCSDFPSKSFLRKGATYRLLGSSSLPELMNDPANFATEETVVRVLLSDHSSLQDALCNEDQNGDCILKNSITLTANHNCTDIECDVETVRVVQVAPNTFYEFVHPPCVNMVFYNDPVKISPRYSVDPVMCGNPILPVASEACCSIGQTNAERNSKYSGERVTFATAENRCSELSEKICDFYNVEGESYLNTGYFWTADSCLVQVKIQRNGMVTVVHKPSDFLERVLHVSDESKNYFEVYWAREGDYPRVDNDCDNLCESLPDGSCLCNTRAIESPIFNSMPASKADVLRELTVGGIDPQVFDSGIYTSTFDADTNITAYLKGNKFDSETMFEYSDDKGRTWLMKNVKLSVHLRGIDSGFTGQSFRNTPQFMSLVPSETNLRDAQYETEAVLDHYFFHDNTPPFLASRLIQRLVLSNPNPRYIQVVANAFKTGTYSAGGKTFGSGKYGDLASTFAAIYLDSAARNVLLDADIASGALREPILKVLALVKSMQFGSTLPVTRMQNLAARIGQMAHEFTTVFSFFLPEYQPLGRIGNAALVSPEATLLDMPKLIGILNGLNSFVRLGLTSCNGGWGPNTCREKQYISSPLGILEFNKTLEEETFAFETFEGPSLTGGFDEQWLGYNFDSHNGNITTDPFDNDNHVLHFAYSNWRAHFFSTPINNTGYNGEPHVVKFKYLSFQSTAGGSIGYVDGQSSLNTQTWALRDVRNGGMQSNGNWLSCQFVLPSELESFRIAIGDASRPEGDAYFDDIQLAVGNETSCTGVNVPSIDPPGRAGYSTEVVDKLSTLLTAGRLGDDTKALIAREFEGYSAEDGLRRAQQLIMTTGEFHTTNTVKSTKIPRKSVELPEPTGKPYRAVVYVLLSGGCDSYNMLAPYTCSNGLYESYLDVRQQVALSKNQLLSIPASNQVCSSFGLHPGLPAIKNLYDDGDLLFFANTGVLSRPVNKDNYSRLTNTRLFAHNHMQKESQRIDPYERSMGTGVLGRMTDVLSQNGHNIGSFSINRNSVATVGKPGVTNAPIIVSRSGFPAIYLDDIKDTIPKLHNVSQFDSGIFADTWSSNLRESFDTNELLSSELDNVTIKTEFPTTGFGLSLETVAKLIATRDARGADVDTFFIEKGGFDTHADVEENLNNLFADINSSFKAFSDELKAMNIWNNVTLIQTSDFARTLTPNGGDGTDHAWGGNYIMMGGPVKGRQILGEYPLDITGESEDFPYVLSRGRMVPTTPWDTVFSGIATWLGVGENDLEKVCPNLYNFDSSYLIDPEDMFDVIEVPAPVPTEAPQPYSPAPSETFTSAPIASESSHPSSIPTLATREQPSQIPSASPTIGPSSMPSVVPSMIPSASPMVEPSSMPSAVPSVIPSASPMVEPSSMPSAVPSVIPSDSPTVEPSSMPSAVPSVIPSESPICRIDEVSDAVFYFFVVQVKACFRLQLYPTGLLEADFTDPTCSNDLFNPMSMFSEYDSVNEANDVVSYKKGDQGYSGTFQFEESATVTTTTASLLSFNGDEKIFALKLVIPRCMKSPVPSLLPSPVPSVVPSVIPSESPICRIDEVSDAVFYFFVVQVKACFRLQLYPTGLLEADFTDPTCSNDLFNPMSMFSEYDSVNAANDVVSYKKGDQGYSGTFQFEESATVTTTTAILLSFNGDEKIFAVKLIIPSCTVEKP